MKVYFPFGLRGVNSLSRPLFFNTKRRSNPTTNSQKEEEKSYGQLGKHSKSKQTMMVFSTFYWKGFIRVKLMLIISLALDYMDMLHIVFLAALENQTV